MFHFLSGTVLTALDSDAAALAAVMVALPHDVSALLIACTRLQELVGALRTPAASNGSNASEANGDLPDTPSAPASAAPAVVAVIAAVVATLREHGTDQPELAAAACSVLERLVDQGQVLHQDAAGEAGACEVLASLLQHVRPNARQSRGVTSALEALAAIVIGHVGNQQRAHGAGVSSVIARLAVAAAAAAAMTHLEDDAAMEPPLDAPRSAWQALFLSAEQRTTLPLVVYL